MSKYNFNAVEAQKFAEGGLRNVLKTPGPNMSRNLMQGEDGKLFVRETINGSAQAPVLREPAVDPSKYVTRTGWDKEGNPIYSTGAAEMAAVNAGISDYNRGLTEGYKERYDQWANTNGMMPLQEAQAGQATAAAGQATATTREIPANAISMRTLQAAQTAREQATADNDKNWKQVTVEEPGVNEFAQPLKQTEWLNVKTGQSLRSPRSTSSAAQQLRELRSSLGPQRESIVEKYLVDNNIKDAQTALEAIKRGDMFR
jgi:hypothetical protein